jgi:hypothetical protein
MKLFKETALHQVFRKEFRCPRRSEPVFHQDQELMYIIYLAILAK